MTTFNATEHISDDPYGPRGFPQATMVLCRWQRIALWALLAGVVLWGILDWRTELLVINAVFTVFFLVSTLYRVMLIDTALSRPREIILGPEDLLEPPDGKEWPKYVVILPMYHEGDVVGKLVDGLRKLDYPTDRLEIRLLIEEDDAETMEAAQALNLEPPFVISQIPVSYPRTKPKACNVAIEDGDFEYLVIYDAEDQPEPDQLKKAAVAFHRSPDNVACIQGKLCFYNSGHNWLTRLFTVDYSTWFGLCLPGLDAYDAPIPLGGTSNHFRWKVLREVGGWDEFNVTEDCDLGLRLYARGWRTRVLDSTTWEQACHLVRFWIPQRSRWVKGYVQTYLVHTRNFFELHKQLGVRGSLHFHLLIGGSVFSQLICPFYWLLVLMWLVFRPVGLSHFFPGPIFAMGALCLFVGNFFFAYTSGIACIRRGMGSLAKYSLLMPFYWIMMSAGAWKGFLQLITKPHHWEKTKHFAE
jgi:cellulose synthase/poly-beta-1,6-N-acetylglucosamine synthase-like glycosyltransferase